MSVTIIGIWQVITEVATLFGHHSAHIHRHHVARASFGIAPWSVPLLAMSLAIMVLVLFSAEALLHIVGVRLTPTPPPVVADRSSDLPSLQSAVTISGPTDSANRRPDGPAEGSGQEHPRLLEKREKPGRLSQRNRPAPGN
jgi:hypothetical protein